MLALLPLKMLLSIVLEATKRSSTAIPAFEDKEQDQQQQSEPKCVPAIAACVIIGYKVLRGISTLR